ncbi:MAG: glycosyltransferase family 1 protein [Oscillospiraceae bacterium]|nr:glycosyltransferase family 1 protein [Oscillospiraceae bacterium]
MNQPIRVLHVVTYMGRGGLETMIMNYYRHIDRSKVQFDFLVHRDFRADYDDEIESLGGRIYRIPRLVPWSRSYRKILEQFFCVHPEYKIVHVHQDCLSSVALKIAQKCGIPVRIAHSHSASQDKNLKYLLKLYYKRSIPTYATQLFACGEEAGRWMFGGAPYRVVNNAINTNLYAYDPQRTCEIRTALKISHDTFVIGHVGRFDAVKNHTFLLDVFAEVNQQDPNSVLLLVGDGNLRPEMEKKAADLGIANRVIFTGIRSDVPDLMQAMDCFAFPSIYEGIPVTLIEAQAAGIPCLVSDGVPAECDKTGLIKRLPLAAGVAGWAEMLMKTGQLSRQNTAEQIVRAGYDIDANARWLQEFYLNEFSLLGDCQ